MAQNRMHSFSSFHINVLASGTSLQAVSKTFLTFLPCLLIWHGQSALITPPTKEPKQISRTTSIKKFIEGMDDSAIARTRQLFNMCDADGDGVITKPELFRLVKELGYAHDHKCPLKGAWITEFVLD